MESSTIIARATPGMRSARAIIRLSGVGTPAALATIGARSTWTRGANRERVTIGHGLSAPVLVARFPAPGSYTGEDSAEILLAGSPLLVDRILGQLVSCPGVRFAQPGEFTARAFLAGKLSLEQAEGVAALIAAENEAQLCAARDLLNGATGATYRDWTERLAAMLALVEAGIDFTDQEDVVAITPGDLATRLGAFRREIEGHLGGAGSEERRDGLPCIFLFGEPNAGKSTLFNALLGRERAVVSHEAGTTRDGLVEVLDLSTVVPGAGAVELVDAPGVDEHGASVIEAGAQGAMREALARADVVVHCDPQGLFGHSIPGTPVVIRVQTKGDVPGASPHVGVIRVCALDGWHLDLLRRAIAEGAWKGVGDALAIVPRHRSLLLAALASIQDVCRAEESDAPLVAEVVAASLRSALDALGEITGRVSPDDVLGRVFATFCIGK